MINLICYLCPEFEMGIFGLTSQKVCDFAAGSRLNLVFPPNNSYNESELNGFASGSIAGRHG